MALIQCNFFAESLGLSTTMTVILPEQTRSQIGMTNVVHTHRHPTLYLLHGLSDDHSIWLRRTSIERYAAALGIAVVMPQVDRSFYTDMAHGNRYWTFVSEELPRAVRSFFPLSDAREDNFVAGLSMGGYGAFKLALNHPDRFAAAASLSGAMDVTDPIYLQLMPEVFQLAFGDQATVAGTANDLLHLVSALGSTADSTAKPLLYQCCGTEDFLYEQNVRFRDTCRAAGVDLTYDEGPGDHSWEYWDQQIQHVLNWLPLRK
ncbi:alpha/beta hydrolase [Paenibacillus guangzhouensis]|uniref:alpha/beta hydrolase n=1 Tax=Paenibacillus guangzhouensis TaxID=1473112 RepID=UPI001266EF9C|nr:alpha/beta hydrolase family protein [Paenibacillus guangzhouensis]